MKPIIREIELRCGHTFEIEFPPETEIHEAAEIANLLAHMNCANCEPESVCVSSR